MEEFYTCTAPSPVTKELVEKWFQIFLQSKEDRMVLFYDRAEDKDLALSIESNQIEEMKRSWPLKGNRLKLLKIFDKTDFQSQWEEYVG